MVLAKKNRWRYGLAGIALLVGVALLATGYYLVSAVQRVRSEAHRSADL